jgi:hypothetical protein
MGVTSRWPDLRPEHRRMARWELRAPYEAEAEVRQVIDTARGLEG